MNIQPEYSQLIKLLSNRLFKIPQYQRAYSWELSKEKTCSKTFEKVIQQKTVKIILWLP